MAFRTGPDPAAAVPSVDLPSPSIVSTWTSFSSGHFSKALATFISLVMPCAATRVTPSHYAFAWFGAGLRCAAVQLSIGMLRTFSRAG